MEYTRPITDFAKDILQSRTNRFPEKAWNKIKIGIDAYEQGQGTPAQLDRYLDDIADYYDNIKTAERWWNSEQFTPPIRLDMWNSKEYGVATSIKTPGGTELL